jgi:acetyl esterase/lipase
MPEIDPEYGEFLAALAVAPALDLDDLEGSRRRQLEALAKLPPANSDGVEIREVEIPGPEGAPPVPARVYIPQAAAAPLPAVCDFHGGGFVAGSFELTHARNLVFCREVGAVIVAVDYRLAPEHPFPAGLEDCYVAWRWISEQAAELGVDRERMALRGTSAGGGLAVATALLCGRRGGPEPCFQHLVMPVLDDRLQTPSMRAYDETPIWNRLTAERSWDLYLGPRRSAPPT